MVEDWADEKASRLIKDAGFALWEAPLAQALRDERERCAELVLHPNAGMVPPDGGAPTERERMENIAADIRSGI